MFAKCPVCKLRVPMRQRLAGSNNIVCDNCETKLRRKYWRLAFFGVAQSISLLTIVFILSHLVFGTGPPFCNPYLSVALLSSASLVFGATKLKYVRRYRQVSCRRCGTRLPEKLTICERCGLEDVLFCTKCGYSLVSNGNERCSECGHRTDAILMRPGGPSLPEMGDSMMND